MKKLLFLLAICTGLAFMSCNDDDDTTPEPEDFIIATIDGNSFSAASIRAIADNTFGEELVLSAGVNVDSTFTIGINIPTSSAINSTFVIDETDIALTFTDAADNAFFTVGELNLSNNNTTDNVLEGTFSFTATDDTDPNNVHSVTNGSFKISYQ